MWKLKTDYYSKELLFKTNNNEKLQYAVIEPSKRIDENHITQGQ